MSTDDLKPEVPDAQDAPAPQDPLSVTPEPPPAATSETWVDEPDGQPPALGSEAHGDLQKRLDGMATARQPSAWWRLFKLIFGK